MAITKRARPLILGLSVLAAACSSSSSVEADPPPATPTPQTPVAAEEAPREAEPTPTAVPVDDEPTDLDRPPQPPDSAGESTGPIDDAEVELETDEGTVQIGEAEVPEAAQTGFPIPDDLDVQLASDAGSDVGFTGVSAMSVDDLIGFYEVGLVAAGFTITDSQVVEGSLAVYSFESDTAEGQVAISEAPGGEGSSVLVTLSDGSPELVFDFPETDAGS